jgi:hypothetical protein
MSDIKLEINIETLTALANMWKFKIHGDSVVRTGPRAGLTTWDLEFPSLTIATSFATTILSDVVEIDIRQGDSATSLWNTVTLTLVVGEC